MVTTGTGTIVSDDIIHDKDTVMLAVTSAENVIEIRVKGFYRYQ